MTKNSQFKLWWTAAVTVLLSTGCLYQNQVLPYLDKQAESLLICNHSENNRNWHQIKTDLISQTKPQSASDRKLKRLLDYLDTAFQASGLADCQKWGVSSTIKGNCFENRIILIPGNDPQGLLWHIWNGNTDIKPYISTLPGSSSTAIALNLDPSRVSGDLTKLLQFDNLINTATIRSLLGEKLLQDLSGCSGVWLAAAGDSSGEISLPDPDNKVFQELIRNFDPNEKKSATEYRTVIKNHQICYEICTEQYDFNGEPRLRISWHTEHFLPAV